MEATIVDNKIVVKKKESEDDKIKKEIIVFLKEGKPYHCPDSVIRQEWAAWLEKQGEHVNFLNKIQIGDKVTRNKDGMLVNLSQLNRTAKPTNEEQKDTLEDAILNGNEDGLIAETIRYKKERQGEQNHNWSEEDERILNDTFDILSSYYSYTDDVVLCDNINKAENWLKSIKERVSSKNKQDIKTKIQTL